jgi:hypothetical protein
MAAMRIGAPMPSTTGTPSCSLNHAGFHLHRALRDALRDDHVGALLRDQGARGGEEGFDHPLAIVGDVLQVEA